MFGLTSYKIFLALLLINYTDASLKFGFFTHTSPILSSNFRSVLVGLMEGGLIDSQLTCISG